MHWGQVENDTYWLLFVTSFVAVALWESFRPRLALILPTKHRWGRHGILFVVGTAIPVTFCRITPVIVALAVANMRFGLFNRFEPFFPISFISTILLLDFVSYAIHWCFQIKPSLV